jgi:hypothetical protein
MAIKLDLLIELDSKGAVKGVQALNSEIDKTEKVSKKTKEGTDDLFGSIFKGVTIANLASKGLDFLQGEFFSCFNEAMEAEKIQSKLNSTLESHGESVKYAGALWEDFSNTMRGLTGVEGDQVKSLVALAFNLGISSNKMKEVVQGAIGLSAMYGGSLESSVDAISKAYQGNWKAIDGMIPAIKNLGTEQEKMIALQDMMAKGFKISTDAMKGATGQIITAKNDWKDFKESVGNGFLSLFSGMKSFNGAVTGQGYMYDKLKAMHDREVANLEFEAAAHRKYSDIVLQEAISFDPVRLAQDQANAAEALNQKLKDSAERYKELIEKKKRFKEMMPEVIQVWKDETSAEEKWLAAMTPNIPAMNLFTDAIEINEEALDLHQGKLMDWMAEWWDSTSTIDKVAEGLYMLDGALADMGITLGPQAQAFRDAADGAVQLVDGLSSGDPFQVIGGAIKIATNLIKAFAGDGVGEAIKRETQWMDLNDDLKKQLRDLAEAMGDTHLAASTLLNDIIDEADVTVNNFDQYARRVQEILSDYDRNQLSIGETAKEIGESFSSLLAKAQQIGTEGSNSMITLFEDLSNRGMQIAEINKYINEQLQAGLEGYRAYLEGDFSTATIGVYESLLAYEKKVEENKALVNGIQGITQALIGLSNTTRLTEEEFDQFEKAAGDAFKKLTDQGFTSREALTQLAPMLARLNFLNQEYGLTLDDNTKALIEKAKAEGINLDKYKSQEEIFGDMATSLKDLVDIFKNVFPNAIQKTSDAWANLNKISKNTQDPTGTGKNKTPGETAAIGFYSSSLPSDTVIQAHQGEEVIINSKGTGPSISGRGDDRPGTGRGMPPINIYGTWDIKVSPKSGIDTQDLVAGLKIAVHDNLRGIADEIYTAISRRMN